MHLLFINYANNEPPSCLCSPFLYNMFVFKIQGGKKSLNSQQGVGGGGTSSGMWSLGCDDDVCRDERESKSSKCRESERRGGGEESGNDAGDRQRRSFQGHAG